MGSDSMVMKEVRVRMSGTASNRNYGNLAPDVQLTFLTEGVENWDEAIQQMINTTHDAFVLTALALVGNFDGSRDAASMLAELGIKPQTSISVMVPLEGEQSFEPDRDEDGFGDDGDDDDGDRLPDWLRNDEPEFDDQDTPLVVVPKEYQSSIGADF